MKHLLSTMFCFTLIDISSDLNECEVGTSICAENEDCHDVLGSYDCVCSAGWYMRDGDQCCMGKKQMSWLHPPNSTALYHLSVADIDECEVDTDGCSHNCTNTNGSYVCSCPDGFLLHSDGLLCTGNDYTTITVRCKLKEAIIIIVMF